MIDYYLIPPKKKKADQRIQPVYHINYMVAKRVERPDNGSITAQHSTSSFFSTRIRRSQIAPPFKRYILNPPPQKKKIQPKATTFPRFATIPPKNKTSRRESTIPFHLNPPSTHKKLKGPQIPPRTESLTPPTGIPRIRADPGLTGAWG